MIVLDGPVRGPDSLVACRTDLHQRLMSAPGVALECPGCGRSATAYRRSINRAQAAALLVFERHRRRQFRERFEEFPFEAVDVLEEESHELARKVGGDYAKLRLWSLIRPDSRSGWFVTGVGSSWVQGKISVPRYVVEFSGKILRQPYGEPLTFTEALKTEFSMSDLLDADPMDADLQMTLCDAAGRLTI